MVVHAFVDFGRYIFSGIGSLSFRAVVVGVAVDVQLCRFVDGNSKRGWFAVMFGVYVGAGGLD